VITTITVHKLATYEEPITFSPRKINFFYGSNGAGKTTLSNLIQGSAANEESSVLWASGSPTEVLVYNRIFVEQNFGTRTRISGIFTLGKDSKEVHDFIEAKSQEIVAVDARLQSIDSKVTQLGDQISRLQKGIEEECWTVQLRYGERYRDALKGHRASKKAFAEECIARHRGPYHEHLMDLQDLDKLYAAAFSKNAIAYEQIEPINVDRVTVIESCVLLGESITGSTETPIGKFIAFLGNSDWVKDGMSYAERAGGRCPYCQQEIPETLAGTIAAFFDKRYEEDCRELQIFNEKYCAYTVSLLERLKAISRLAIPLLSYDQLITEVEVLERVIAANMDLINDKIASPSEAVILHDLIPIVKRINLIIDGFNSAISKNNIVVRSQPAEQVHCKSIVWSLIVGELKAKLDIYVRNIKGRLGAISKLQQEINELKEIRKGLASQVEDKQQNITSVLPTVNSINGILKRFGFESFALAENINEKGTYRIVRPDGSDAQTTLSEGEYRFISFLYFYHLIYGSRNRSSVPQNKVIVIDDPISSLDSNVLFIVSTLVRSVLRDCKENRNGVQQVFLLTHNVYFHKEVSFLGSRETYSPNVVAFWVVRKIGNITRIDYRDRNPIQTSYELLWSELQNTEGQHRVTIFNTLRRILEYYFNIIGGMKYEECIDEFEGEDKLICKALISCINDGSHFITDDYTMCFEASADEHYVRVFRLIFEKTGHGNHYRMMMRMPLEAPS